ncbi:MAG: DUF3313 family protein [Methylomarinum sp.]|nr:DUF3313 domain-containing protein [Methylococcales bacterium]NOR70457.1 DUF3313 family protein [Methylomarinum sp.]
MKKKILTLFAVSLLATGCATTYQEKSVEPAGFLGNYSMLKEGKSDQALLVYRNPELLTLCKKYDKVLIDPITIWVHDKSSVADVSVEDQQRLTNYLYQSVKEALSGDYQLVTRPGPGVMRVRGAITEADNSYVVLDVLTSIHPGTLAISGLKQLAFGSGTFVAQTAVEFSIEDSLTHQVLTSGVDKRVGGKSWTKKFNSWGKVEAAYDYWADKLKTRLAECKAGTLEL